MVDQVLELPTDNEQADVERTATSRPGTLSAIVAACFLMVGVWSGIDAGPAGADTQADPLPTLQEAAQEAAAQDEGLQALAWENLMTILSLEANELGRAKWDSINAARRAASFDANR